MNETGGGTKEPALTPAPAEWTRAARTTIDDVAAKAGVSIKTVSRVMNDEPGVRAETRDRVRDFLKKR